jgi:hypothetical protein
MQQSVEEYRLLRRGCVAVRFANTSELVSLLAQNPPREWLDEWAWELSGDNATEVIIDASARLECARLLLQHGARSTAQRSGLTLLHLLLNRGLDDVVELFEAQLVAIKPAATEMLIGMQDLELPALVTLEILDALRPNLVTMYVKWNLITHVKHWHDRRRNKEEAASASGSAHTTANE